ncbi:MAG: hypothetical protein GEU95_07100 [Rhizobiales bacterium]|nr:hypothetical protein [Hyphomicrobiales bacterium]
MLMHLVFFAVAPQAQFSDLAVNLCLIPAKKPSRFPQARSSAHQFLQIKQVYGGPGPVSEAKTGHDWFLLSLLNVCATD